jgi:hypothetical protein
MAMNKLDNLQLTGPSKLTKPSSYNIALVNRTNSFSVDPKTVKLNSSLNPKQSTVNNDSTNPNIVFKNLVSRPVLQNFEGILPKKDPKYFMKRSPVDSKFSNHEAPKSISRNRSITSIPSQVECNPFPNKNLFQETFEHQLRKMSDIELDDQQGTRKDTSPLMFELGSLGNSGQKSGKKGESHLDELSLLGKRGDVNVGAQVFHAKSFDSYSGKYLSRVSSYKKKKVSDSTKIQREGANADPQSNVFFKFDSFKKINSNCQDEKNLILRQKSSFQESFKETEKDQLLDTRKINFNISFSRKEEFQSLKHDQRLLENTLIQSKKDFRSVLDGSSTKKNPKPDKQFDPDSVN